MFLVAHPVFVKLLDIWITEVVSVLLATFQKRDILVVSKNVPFADLH